MRLRTTLPAIASALLLAACGAATGGSVRPSVPASVPGDFGSEGTVTIYSGRNEELVGPLLEQFEEQTGIEVEARYGDSAEMANLILTEGENSPADVFFSQDAGALGAVAAQDRLATLPDEVLERVDERFRSPDGAWVGTSGRARVVAYNTEALTEEEMPDSIFDFTDPEWSGRIGWAPTNASFQAFVTAMRVLDGEDVARDWLEGIQANDPKVYESNGPALDAVIAGEIDVAFINHYYLMQRLAEEPDVPAANHFLTGGDPGALINVAGAGILSTAPDAEAAQEFVAFLVSEEAQRYFAEQTKEYPLAAGVPTDPALMPLDEIESPEIDLSDLADLEGTLELLQELGIL